MVVLLTLLLTTKLDQRLLMNQQLKQVIGLLQVTTLELKQQVKTWIESNPLIELKEETPEDEQEANDYQTHGKIKVLRCACMKLYASKCPIPTNRHPTPKKNVRMAVAYSQNRPAPSLG